MQVHLEPKDAFRIQSFPLLLVYDIEPALLTLYLWLRKEKLPSACRHGYSLASGLKRRPDGVTRKGKALIILFLARE